MEADRLGKERKLTQDIIEFNHRVSKQIKSVEQSVSQEISQLSVELSREEQRRSEGDKNLLQQVNDFLEGLKHDETGG